MLRYFAFCLVLQIVHSSCPAGFELVYNECRGNYSRINTFGDVAFQDVIDACAGILSQPIIIHCPEDQAFWSSRVPTGGQWTVMGLVCDLGSKKWIWADGSELDFIPPPGFYNGDINSACQPGITWTLRSDGYWTIYNSHGPVTTDVFCAAPNRQPVPRADGCESFEDESDDGICYQVGNIAQSWQESQLICRSFGANVASIHNTKENSFIRRLAVSKGVINGVFLGAATEYDDEGRPLFIWLDGSDWDYENFYPVPLIEKNSCVAMDTSDVNGEWAVVDCDSKMSVACERQQHYHQPACSPGPYVEGQIIYSPGFPFDASTPCDFILSVEAGKKVQAEIFFLEANPCCDRLVAYDSLGPIAITNITGILTEPRTVTSSSYHMHISWQPNGGVNVRGMMFTYRSL